MGREFADLESVRSHLPRAAAMAATELQRLVSAKLGDLVAETESPIEAIFVLWWEMLAEISNLNQKIRLWPQFGFAPINGRSYRADFAIWPKEINFVTKDTPFRPIVVELDGHDFHERTKEQVIWLNQRDRDFQEQGYTVLHFSGSELHKDPEHCLVTVIEAASREMTLFRAALAARNK